VCILPSYHGLPPSFPVEDDLAIGSHNNSRIAHK
jgi:hypothetical protein